jgi:xanthine dehydrogenase small subunit
MSEFLAPASLSEALDARAQHADYVVVAGGTDYMVASKDRVAPAGMINVFGLDELSRVSETDGGGLRIGACVTYAALLADSRIAQRFPVLRAACREVGASQIQARGTMGGNIATSSPVGDSLPPLLALGAHIEVASRGQQRRIPYDEFLLGYRKIDLAPDELIVAIDIPAAHASAVQQWRKVGTRRAQSISKVMMAAVGHVEDGKIAATRIALGAVADRTIRARAAEGAIVGQVAGAETAELAAQALASEIHPIDDLRSSAEYRLGVAQNLVRRFVLSL